MRTGDGRGHVGDYAVAWLLGGKRMQDTVTVFPDGRWQVLPVYFHVRGKQWVDYTESKQGVLTPDHPFFWTNFRRTANHECLDCHTSGLAVSFDRAARRFETHFADAGVGCESCHGAGAKHAETQEVADIVQPAKLSPDRQLAICGQCHGPRNALFPVLDPARRFRPGDAYEESFQLLGLMSGNDRSADFFADGRPSSSSFELQALLQSRCHRLGGATCLTCHTAPHEKHHGAELAAADLDEGCRSCHERVFVARAQHTKHRSAAAQRCVACHMPPTVSAVLDHFADHSIDVPDPGLTAAHAVPNGCNSCHAHAAEPPNITAEKLARLWPDAAARQGRRRRLADAFDEETAAASREPLLRVIADRDEASSLRASALALFARRFPREAGSQVIRLLDAADPLLRAQAAETAGRIRARPLGPRLTRLAFGDPSLPVRLNATIALFDLGDRAGAERSARVLVADPRGDGLASLHMLLGLAALGHRDLAGAERELDRAVSLTPFHLEALLALSDVHAAMGKTAESRRDLELVLFFDPRNPGARARLGEKSP
jgi:hypothetical protein